MCVLKYSWVILCVIIGSVFLIQCEKERPHTERTEQTQNQQDDENDAFRRHDEGRGGDAATGIAEGHEVDVADDRNELIQSMQELLSDLDDELEDKTESDEMEVYEQVQNNRLELSQLISEAEGTDEESWKEIREDVQEAYVRIAVDYNDRVRPEGAHGGRGVWILRNLG